ncbi:hypothetical protein [Streptomyces sp. NPDC048603]|uniref:hypothetical protein n=1 Tax=Streptomyces sp. NPDC048603 TaxID=3365577 RepID=UPI003724BEE9
MRTSARTPARIPGILAGLALAVGGVVFAAPAAHADSEDCVQHLMQQNVQITDAVKKACYQGQSEEETTCTSGLQGAGVTEGVAAQACKVARQ